MSKRWGAALAAVVLLSGCGTVRTKPVEVETPGAERHFVVMRGGSPDRQ
jgi:uncharacterized protein YceK